MSIYNELASLAANQDNQEDEFYRIASWFPHRLLAAMENRLGSPAGSLKLVTPDLQENPWDWKDWSGRLRGTDLDDESLFIICVSIRLDHGTPLRGFTQIFPAFAFRPVHGGILVHLLGRLPDGGFEKKNQSIVADNEESFGPLLDDCVDLCRQAFRFDPFAESPNPKPIGFDINTQAHRMPRPAGG
jgi:hypothetical protein